MNVSITGCNDCSFLVDCKSLQNQFRFWLIPIFLVWKVAEQKAEQKETMGNFQTSVGKIGG